MNSKKSYILNIIVFIGAFLAVAPISFLKQRQQHTPAPSPRPSSSDLSRKDILSNQLQALIPDVVVTDESVEDIKVKKHDKDSSKKPTYKEVKVKWETEDPNAPHLRELPDRELPADINERTAKRVLKAAGRRTREGVLGQQRALDLNSEQMLMIAVDSSNRLRYWYVFPDPSVVRGAQPLSSDANKQREKLFQQSKVEFFVAAPDDKNITELRFYHPRWTGSEHILELVGTVSF